MKIVAVIAAALLPLTILCGQNLSQPSLEDLFQQFQKNNGDILFPAIYRSFEEQIFSSDQVMLQMAQPMTPEVENQLRLELAEWIRISREATRFLAGTLAIRSDALAMQADEFATEQFEQAEQALRQAADFWRKGKKKQARESQSRAQSLYMQAQAEAIRNRLLGEVHIFLQESRDLDAEKYAPRTLALVEELLRQVESLLRAGQYDNPALIQRSRQLEEEALHLLHLVQLIRGFFRQKETAEAFLLSIEGKVDSLARLLNYQPRFSQGLPRILSELIATLDARLARWQATEQRLRELEQENQLLREKNASLEKKLTGTRALEELVDKLRGQLQQHGIALTLQGTQLQFLVEEIPFAPGAQVPLPEADPVLENLAAALAQFPNQTIELELTLQAPGNEEYNRNLAQQRARALVHYLQAHLPIPDDQIRARGLARPTTGSNSLQKNSLRIVVSLTPSG